MRNLLRLFSAIVLLLAVATGAAVAPVSAQQPSSVSPSAQAVQERQLLNELNRIQGRVTIPDHRAATLEQPEGRDWRHFHEVTLRWIGAIAILGMLALLIVFYLWRGMVKLQHGRSGRTVVRFNGFERFVHWLTATCFILLAITGLNITFGKKILLPLIGPESFTAFSQWGKYIHNYLSFPFTLGVILIFLIWIAGNIPNRTDIEWFKRGGGIVGHDHPPAWRFNAGQKMVYWIVVIGGGLVAASGYVLMFPFYGTGVADMQTAQMVHAIVSVLFVAVMLAHIYIGTLGMEGAFEAMGSGTVDVNWAREHHRLWLEEEIARTGPNESETQARARATPAE